MDASSRSRLRRLLPALVAVASLLAISPLAAQTGASAGAARIAVVDTQRIIRESDLFTVGRQKLTEEFSARDQALKLEEARLRELEARRDRELDTLSSQDALELRREIEENVPLTIARGTVPPRRAVRPRCARAARRRC